MLKKMLIIATLFTGGIINAGWVVHMSRPGCTSQECLLDENNFGSIDFGNGTIIEIAVEFEQDQSFVAQATVAIDGQVQSAPKIVGTVGAPATVTCTQEGSEDSLTVTIVEDVKNS